MADDTDVTNAIETGQEIAVIGMAARFPDARNINEFWENLKNGVESFYHFSDEELLEAGIDPGLLTNPHYVKTYGCLEDIEYFDAAFFGYTPKEAEIMDPQIRIFHECVWTALEHAGYDSRTYDGLIGLYAGATANMDWQARAILSGKSNEIGSFAAGQLIQKDYLSIRISYKLNLMGPSFVLSTACSTSLVAIHVACQAILNGECDIALAGGITVVGTRKGGYLYREKMVFSPDGHCRAFDAAAKGFVAGDGAGIVVLKRLEDATSDQDHIYAVIKGTAINNDGMRKAGFTASSVEGQAEVIKIALQVAEVEPESIGYIETHGTGTELGDPVEIEGLKLAYNTNKKGFCALGSIKTNMGHLDSAAGVAGFIKTLLALMHRKIPPSLHFEIPNPLADFINSPFYVNTGLTQWLKGKYPLRAGVSSFGIGGTNAHVILEEAPQISKSVGQWVSGSVNQGVNGQRTDGRGGSLCPPLKSRDYQLILLSAKTKSALERMRQNLAEYFKKNLLNRGNHEIPTNPGQTLADAAYTLQVGRKAFEHRWMTVSSTLHEAIEALTSPGAGETHLVSPEEESFDLKKTDAVVDKDSLLHIGRLWLHGHKPDWKGLYPGHQPSRLSLPTYPFERQRYWIEDEEVKRATKSFQQNPQLNHPQDMSDWFYLPTWKRTILETPNNNDSLMNRSWHWLVFMNDLPPVKLLVRQLKEKQQDVTVVKNGKVFQRVEVDDNNDTYTLNPKENAHYNLLFKELVNRDLLPDKIVHCWSVTGTKDSRGALDAESFDRAQYPGFYSLLYLARALGKQNFSHDIHIAVLSNHMQEVIGGETLHPEKSTILGLLKSIPQEYPGIRCTSIDFELPGTDTANRTTWVNPLLEELMWSPVETVVAYRNNQRWVQMFEPLHLEEPRDEQMRLRKNGVYLVTGGLGNIGLMFSELLAKQAGARLILTGRSDFPGKPTWDQWLETHPAGDPISLKIKKIREIEALGGEVLYIRADVGHRQQMQHAISQAEETCGAINGVIHAAGVIEGESMRAIQDLSHDDCRLQFQAKVYGTLILEELFKDKHLDFCWMLSSVSCVLGGLGFGAYASANIFMDALVKQHNQFNGSRWFSLNWDGMEAEKSIALFKRMLPLKKIDQLVVSGGGNLHERINRWIKLETLKEKTPAAAQTTPNLYPRPNLSTAYVAPRTPDELTIARIWQGILGYDEIGIHDDFLELGGDSLKAITAISLIHQQLNVNLPVAEFFNKPTPEGIGQYLSGQSSKDTFVSIEPIEKKEYHVLSSAQKRLYIIHQLDENNLSYNISKAVVLEGEPQTQRLGDTFNKLIQRHESLRTSFGIIKEKPVQQICDEIDFKIEYHEIGDSGTPRPNNSPSHEWEKVETILGNFIRPFDLSRASLLRAGLIKIHEKKHVLMVDMHHIISDGLSLEILIKDFICLFSAREPQPLRIQYKDFSEWQNLKEWQSEMKKQEGYWLKEFEEDSRELHLPTDFDRPTIQGFEGNEIDFEIDENVTKPLKKIAADEDATLFMLMIALYNIFLSKLTGQEEIVIGTGVAGRKRTELLPIIGMFVNTLPLKNYPTKEKTFKEFLREVKEKTLLAFQNQDYPFEELVDKVVPNRKRNRNPLFDTVIVSHNLTVEAANVNGIETSGLSVRSYPIQRKVSSFDMSFLFADLGHKLYFIIEYSTALFKKETMEMFIIYFKEIVSALVENNDTRLEDITISHQMVRARQAKPTMELNF